MTSKQIQLVKRSWLTVAALDEEIVGQLFYTRLFEVNPELKPLFKNPMNSQYRKLISMIGFVIARLDALDDIIEEVQKLAQRHVKYGVQERHYAMVGAALLWTLQKGLNDIWNQELEEAWIACYTLLSAAMIQASSEVIPS